MILRKTVTAKNSFSLVEEVVVHLDLRVGFEVIWHQHDRNLNVTEFINLEKETERERIITLTKPNQHVCLLTILLFTNSKLALVKAAVRIDVIY